MIQTIEAIKKDPYDIVLDKKGYFIIRLEREDKMILADYYNYDKEHLLTIKGKDARSIYWTILDRELIASMSHAAYLGKELTKAEYALTYQLDYQQQ